MAQPTPVSKLLDKDETPDGSIIMEVQGKITKLFNAKKGTNANGEWEIQNGEFTDFAGDTIPLTLSNCSQPLTARGKTVTIRSVKTKSFGWQGVKIEDRSWIDKDTQEPHEQRSLKLTGTAEVDFGVAGGSYQKQQPNNQQTTQKNVATQPNKPAPQQAATPAPQHPKVVLSDLIALHGDIRTLVNEKYAPKEGETPIDTSGFIPTIFIEACKNGLVHNYAERAAKPVPKRYPPAPTDPMKWKECIISSGANEGKTLAEISADDLKKMFAYYEEKGANTAIAECVYQAARDRNLFPKDPIDPNGDLNPVADDDIPF